MQPVQTPRHVTRADVPTLPGRIRNVWSRSNRRNRPAREQVVLGIGYFVIGVLGFLIGSADASAVERIAALGFAFLLVVALMTAGLLAVRFGRPRRE